MYLRWLVLVIIINTITCPCTVLLNVLVIKAVKTMPRLRTNSNILLACLAVTDALTGILGQPFFVLWKIFLLFGLSNSKTFENCYYGTVIMLLIASYLHLMLVTFERLVAIRFTMQYPNIITENNMKIAVLVVWIISSIWGIFEAMELDLALRLLLLLHVLFSFVSLMSSCIVKHVVTKRR